MINTQNKSTDNIMLTVILACIPAVITSTYFFGNGIISNIIYSIVFSVITESICLRLRGKNILDYISDYSAILTAILFALCLPPDFSVFKILLGIIFAVAISKHIYGGLGHNIFNPAMVGFIILLVAFPQDFTNWPKPNGVYDIFNNNLNSNFNIADDISQATPLDPMITSNIFSNNLSFYIINLSWMISGLYLLYKKIVPINLSLGFILGLFITASFSCILSDNIVYNPIQQLFLGATMMGAFFIISDPVTACTSNTGRWIYSILAGILCYLIREFGGYPDGAGFAILFMNTWVPLINKLTIKKSHIKI